MERFRIVAGTDKTTAEELSKLLEGREVSRSELFPLLKLSEALDVENGSVRFESVADTRALVPGTRIHINLNRAAITSAALILDAIKTRGLAIGLLASIGYNPKFFSMLSLKNAQFCNFVTLKQMHSSGEDVNSDGIKSFTHGKECPHLGFPCEHREKNVCKITLQAINSNFSFFVDMGMVITDTGGRISAIR